MAQWVLSEEILTLQLYISGGRKVASTSSLEVKKIKEITGKSVNSIVLKTANFRSLDPETPSKGMSNVSDLDRYVWKLYQGRWNVLSRDAISIASDSSVISDEKKYGKVERPSTYYLPDYPYENKRRVGQERVRSMALINYGGKCCICGLDHPSLLRASHIVPWSANPNIRADPSNVICLCVLHDGMFDSGLISVDSTNKIITQMGDGYHPELSYTLKSLDGKSITMPINQWAQPNQEYLKYHRKNVFLGTSGN